MLNRIANKSSIIALVAGIVFCSAADGYAQDTVDDLINGIDLDALDEIIEDAALQIRLLKLNGDAPDVGGNTDTSLATDGSMRPALPRTRADPLCFAENLGDQKSRAALDEYFNSVEVGLARSQAFLSSFDVLKGNFVENGCPPVMVEMAQSASNEMVDLSRADMAELVLHLETCWPDEGVAEADGAPLDIDARYYRARGLMQSVRRVGRGINAAKAFCG